MHSSHLLTSGQSDPRIRLILRVEDAGLAKACIQGMLSAKAELL